jgi:hypothetical protein
MRIVTCSVTRLRYLRRCRTNTALTRHRGPGQSFPMTTPQSVRIAIAAIAVVLLIGVATGAAPAQTWGKTHNPTATQALVSARTNKVVATYSPLDDTIRVPREAPDAMRICLRDQCRSLSEWLAAGANQKR